jgi:hypothetical protein
MAVLELTEGRTLSVVDGELVEVRAASGQLELRIRMTEDGPVLELESVRLMLKAAESIDVECEDFNVNAQGEIALSGKADVRVDAEGEVHVTGEIIHLN